MIRIDVSKIKNWELIREKHSEWYYKKIFPQIGIAIEKIEKEYQDNESNQKVTYENLCLSCFRIKRIFKFLFLENSLNYVRS